MATVALGQRSSSVHGLAMGSSPGTAPRVPQIGSHVSKCISKLLSLKTAPQKKQLHLTLSMAVATPQILSRLLFNRNATSSGFLLVKDPSVSEAVTPQRSLAEHILTFAFPEFPSHLHRQVLLNYS